MGKLKATLETTWKILKSHKKIVLGCGIVGVLLIALVVTGIVLRGKNAAAASEEMAVQSAEASVGTIRTTVEGTGTVESGTATDVVVPTGIKVKDVLVESGDEVTAGQTLATLDEASIASELLEVTESIESVEEEIDGLSSDAGTEGTTEYLEAKVLDGELADLTSAKESLTGLLETQAITASCAGIVSSVNVSEDSEISQSSGSSGANTAESAGTSQSTGSNMSASGGSTGAYQLTFLTADVEQPAVYAASSDSADKEEIKEITLNIAAPTAGGIPQDALKLTEEQAKQYSGEITWNCITTVFQAGFYYAAEIKLTPEEGYAFPSDAKDILVTVPGASSLTKELKTEEADDTNTYLLVTAAFPATKSESGSSNNDTNNTENNTDNNTKNNTDQNNSSSDEKSASSGTASSGSASSSQSTGSSSSDAASSATYSAYEAAAFSIADAQSAAVSINVDELDILSVQEGQTATITMDALEDQSFEGTITAVSNEATSGSSSAKYAVTITFDKTEDMRLGMSASATINVEEAENAVLIPVDALQERGNSTFVYTEADEDGNLSGEVEVETGLSNGTQVEITSGLKKGDTVYYLKISGDSSDSGDMGGMGFGEMPDGDMGGGMPGDGMGGGDMGGGGDAGGSREMPDGGGRGNQ